MSESRLDLLAVFTAELLGVRFRHTKHIVHATAAKEASLLIVLGAIALLELLAGRSSAALLITLEYLVEDGEECSTNDHVGHGAGAVDVLAALGEADRDPLRHINLHFFLHVLELGQELLRRVQHHVDLAAVMERAFGAMIDDFALRHLILDYVNLRNPARNQVVV